MRPFLNLMTWVLVASVVAGQSEEVEAVAQRHLKEGFTVGFAVGTVTAGETWTKGYGKVAPDGDAVPDAHTVYEIGSITKVFTGILLAEAVRRGEVALEDPVEKHLPEGVTIPSKGDTKIRLVDLATHRSGLPRMPLNFKPKAFSNPFADYGTEELFSGLPKTKLWSMPGTKYAYSNYAFGLLGHVLVRKSKARDYDTLLADRITKPLGMKETRCVLDVSMGKRFAPAYNNRAKATKAWDFDALAGCGAIRSTVADMLVFAQANLEPDKTKIAASLKLAQKIQCRDDAHGTTLGLGWHYAAKGTRPWHNGGTGGFRSMLMLSPQDGCAAIVLSNTTATKKVDRLGVEILKAVLND